VTTYRNAHKRRRRRSSGWPRELDAQALVVSPHHNRGLGRLAHDGTLASLLHGTPCPVIVCD